jgi:hypothetical protein
MKLEVFLTKIVLFVSLKAFRNKSFIKFIYQPINSKNTFAYINTLVFFESLFEA